jgi:ubiquitin-protein ligase
MQKSALFLSIISFVILSQSCSRQKGYFQQNVVQNYHRADIQEEVKTIEIAKEPVIIESEPILTSSTIEDFATINKVAEEIKYKEKVIKLEKVLAKSKPVSKPQKLNFVQKIILKKVQKKVAKSGNLMGFHDWNPYLKIGAILLGIGIVLAIFGLSVVGGVAAFLGLIFAILGLLGSVNVHT